MTDKEVGTISLSQEQYTKEIMEKYNMLDNTPSKVPMAPTQYEDGENKVALPPPEHETFRAILGSVNFMCMCTIPDIAFAVSVICKRQIAATQLLMRLVKRMLRYLHGSPAGGAAAAALEWGALARPSAPTSTSTRWALVTM
jgi:hypothetical protein